MAKLSVVLDTQLLLRGATARSASLNSKVYQAWIEGRYDVLLSQETLDELLRVLTEPKVVRQLRITNEILVSTATLLLSKAKFVTVSRKITLCRDPNDDKFLECAVATSLRRSLSGKGISLCELRDSLCLCGGIAKENAHHRGTEFALRTTETNSPTDS